MFAKKIFNVTILQVATTITSVSFGLILANYFGASSKMDAYVIASNFILTLNGIFAINQARTIIPFLAKYKDTDVINLNSVVNSIIRLNIIIFTLLSFVLFLFSKGIAIALAPGVDDATHTAASHFLKILSLFLLFGNISGIGQGLLEYNYKFGKAAFINLIKTVLILLSFLLVYKFLDIYAAPLAYLLSILFISIVYVIIIQKSGISIISSLKIYNQYVREYLYLLAPIILAALFLWFIGIVDTFIASFFDVGSISYLGYCRRIVRQASLLSNAISTVFYPLLSKINTQKNDKELSSVFLQGLQTIFVINLFVTLFIIIYSTPIISVLFERGNFLRKDTLMASSLTKFYFFVIICSPIGTYLANIYCARRKMKLINLLSVCSSLINLVLNCILGFFFGIFGIAAASSIAFLTGNILQLVFIKRFIDSYKLTSVIKKFLAPLSAGTLAFLLFYFFKKEFFNYNQQFTLVNKIVYLSVHFTLFSLVYFLLCFAFKTEIVLVFYKKIMGRIKRDNPRYKKA